MNSNGFHFQGKTREQIENDLLEQLRQRHIDWIGASEQERDAARRRFMDALHWLNRFVFAAKALNN